MLTKILIVLYLVKQKSDNVLEEKNVKITKRSHACKGYSSTYNVVILNYFNPELQIKDIEFAIKNKLVNLLSKLGGFKFVTALVLEFKKIESNDETKYSTFYLRLKAEAIILIYSFVNYYLTLLLNIQKSLGKGWD